MLDKIPAAGFLSARDRNGNQPKIGTKLTQENRPVAAAIWMIGSITGFSLVAVSGRALAVGLDTFEVMLYRSLVGVVVLVVSAILTRQTDALRPTLMRLHLLRNLMHFAGQNLWLYALSLITLAQLCALEFSYPILVALAAPLFLGERLTRLRVGAALFGFAGILIVARPFGAGGLSVGLLAALLCAVGFAGAAIVTKKLTRQTSVLAILFWLTTMQSGFGFFCAVVDGQIALPPTALIPWVLAIGVGGLGAHLCLTKALSLAPASIVTPIDFLRLPLLALIGSLAYGEPLDLWVLIGGAVIFAANFINIRAETRPRPQSMA